MQRALYETAPLSKAEKLRFSINMSSLLGAFESSDMLWRQGLFDELAYPRTLRSIAVYMQSPRVLDWWAQAHKDRFIPPFSGVIDEIAARAEAKARPAARLAKGEGPQE